MLGDDRVIASLGPGEGFGEIALLRRSTRTASVVARTDLRLRALGSDHFLSVVLGYTPSAREASVGVDQLLDRYDPDRTGRTSPATPGDRACPSCGSDRK